MPLIIGNAHDRNELDVQQQQVEYAHEMRRIAAFSRVHNASANNPNPNPNSHSVHLSINTSPLNIPPRARSHFCALQHDPNTDVLALAVNRNTFVWSSISMLLHDLREGTHETAEGLEEAEWQQGQPIVVELG